MRIIYKIAAYIFLPTAAAVTALLAVWGGLYLSADTVPPAPMHDFSKERVRRVGGQRIFMGSSLRQSDNGFWELHLRGDAEERGAAFGALTDSLLDLQEEAFVRQIREMIPSERYLKFLRYLTVTYNRNITRHIPEEYLREIAAMSRYSSSKYDFIGEPYMRQLNYHAAHDIGHAMQEYMLVGCSAFGVWGDSSSEGMLVGRNFDFHVGDDFARNRLLTFCRPDRGYGFVSIGWAGMVGVLSGMNEKGLTVTLNAAKGPVPLSSATPVSILAREILQYASTIDEACEIAADFELFVSESLLIGSVIDHRCAVLEKTPRHQALYSTDGNIISLTNHFQSEELSDENYNLKNIALSDSRPRLERLHELLAATPLDVRGAIALLRDHKAAGGCELGLRNPLAINQQIAHHSVVFQPEALRMWVSTQYWGMGEWVCYPVGEILRGEVGSGGELYDTRNRIPADSLFMAGELDRLIRYRRIRASLTAQNADSLPLLNPENWEAYRDAARFFSENGAPEKADSLRRVALSKRMPLGERLNLEQEITD